MSSGKEHLSGELYEIHQKLLLMTDRKSPVLFKLAPRSMTFDDLDLQ